MEPIDEILKRWESSLCQEVSVGSLFTRNQIAHKWKSPYRCIVLRETLFWRLTDLLKQALFLKENKFILGSLILIRSSIETFSILVYLNQKIEMVIQGICNFNEFSDLTEKIMLGSKDQSTKIESINILTVLRKCQTKYTKILEIYNSLSEIAHPNYAGVCLGYTKVNEELFETHFLNNWFDDFNDEKIDNLIRICTNIFELEYGDVFKSNFEKLEKWLVENDATLEANKNK